MVNNFHCALGPSQATANMAADVTFYKLLQTDHLTPPVKIPWSLHFSVTEMAKASATVD